MGISANQLRPGTVIEYEGTIWQCLEAQHRTPGNKRAFMQAKMRNIKDGTQKEFKFSSTEGLERVSLFERPAQFLYSDDQYFHFMDKENFEQIQLNREILGIAASFLLPDAEIKIAYCEERPLGIVLPMTMTFTVTEAEPGMKSATASASYKNATIETGMVVKVPQFVQAGDRIIIKTETGEYHERAKG